MADKTNDLVSLFFFVPSDYFLRFLSLRDFAFETVLTAHVVVHRKLINSARGLSILLKKSNRADAPNLSKSYIIVGETICGFVL